MGKLQPLIEKLHENRILTAPEYVELLEQRNPEDTEFMRKLAQEEAQKVFGNRIYVRGLIEFSNYCRNDCLYCGIRRSNAKADRYRLTKEEILDCCRTGYGFGFRTFVLQSGEDMGFSDEAICDIVKSIRTEFPDHHPFGGGAEPRKLRSVLPGRGGAVSSSS